MMPSRSTGSLATRDAARMLFGLLFQDPPRRTRAQPLISGAASGGVSDGACQPSLMVPLRALKAIRPERRCAAVLSSSQEVQRYHEASHEVTTPVDNLAVPLGTRLPMRLPE